MMSQIALPDLPWLVWLISAIIFLWLLLKFWHALKARWHRTAVLVEAKRFFDGVTQRKSLVPVSTTAFLRPKEKALFASHALLWESRSVREFESGFAGFRIARGVYVGGSKGRSVSRSELQQIDDGTLTITNERVIFDGSHSDRVITIEKLLGIELYSDAVELSLEGRQKSLYFCVSNPPIAYGVLMLCRSADPLDLSNETLDFGFKPPSKFAWQIVPTIASLGVAALSVLMAWKTFRRSENAPATMTQKPSALISSSQEQVEPSAIPASSSVPSPLTQQRVWTDSKGRNLEAMLLTLRKDNDGLYVGQFQRPNGEKFEYRIGLLGASDVELVRGLVRQIEQAKMTP